MQETNFFVKWNPELEKLKSLLDLIHEDKPLLESLELSDLITSNDLEYTHKEFLSLYSKYTGLEKDFFQNHWISLRRDNLGTYVDISDELFPIFCQGSLIDEPYNYFKIEYFKSMYNLPKLRSLNVDIDELNEKIKKRMLDEMIKKAI